MIARSPAEDECPCYRARSWLLPGLFLVRDREIVWRFVYSNIGDHPDFDEVLAQIQRCRTRKSDAEEKGPEGQRSSVLG